MEIRNKKVEKGECKFKKIRIYNSTNTMLKESHIQSNNAYTCYKSIRKEYQKLRNTWLQELAARQSEEEGSDDTARFTTFFYQEEQQRVHRIIKAATGNIFGGVTTVESKLNPNAEEWTPTPTKLNTKK